MTDAIAALAQWDTPTICNALELVTPDRRGHGFTTEPFVLADPDMPAIVGHVRTARIRARAPSSKPAEAMAADRLAYYDYIASGGEAPSIVVIEDMDETPGYGAFWGEVNSAIHHGLGCLGCVTNGSFRDLEEWAPGFQMLGGRVGPSHAFVHLVDFGGEVTVYGMAAKDGDIIHADRHGAVIVPKDAVVALPEAVALCMRREEPVLAAARGDGFDIAALKAAMGTAKDIH